MAHPLSSDNLTPIWEFYATYASKIYKVTPAEDRIVEQAQLTHTWVKGVRVDIS